MVKLIAYGNKWHIHANDLSSKQTSDEGWTVSVANEEYIQPIFPCERDQASCAPQIIKHTQMHDQLAP